VGRHDHPPTEELAGDLGPGRAGRVVSHPLWRRRPFRARRGWADGRAHRWREANR